MVAVRRRLWLLLAGLAAAGMNRAEPVPSSDTAVPAPAARELELRGLHRSRYARLANQFRPGLRGDDQALTLVTLLRGELTLPRFRVGVEIQDVRAELTDEQSGVSTALVNALDVLQVYVAGTTAGGVEWQLGRFTMEHGSGRLVAQEVYRDVTRAFTGARATWPLATGGELAAFAVMPVAVRPADRAALLANEIELDREQRRSRFVGVFHGRPGRPSGARAEFYAFWLDERDREGREETRDRALLSVGGRWHRAPRPSHWDFDVEAIVQRGSARASAAPADDRDLDVAAHYLHLGVGYTLERRWSPRLSLEADLGSGDHDPLDDRWQRFDGLFGNRRVDLAPTSIYGALARENIDTVGLRLSLAPSDRADAFLAYRTVRLAAARDAFAGTAVRDPAGASGRSGGRQLDVRWRRELVPGTLRLDVGATHLALGRFMRTAPNATREGDVTFLYGDFTYRFGG